MLKQKKAHLKERERYLSKNLKLQQNSGVNADIPDDFDERLLKKDIELLEFEVNNIE